MTAEPTLIASGLGFPEGPVWMPDGTLLCVEHNDAFEAGGMHFEVVEPFTALKVTYSGRAVILDDPLVMANPRKASLCSILGRSNMNATRPSGR